MSNSAPPATLEPTLDKKIAYITRERNHHILCGREHEGAMLNTILASLERLKALDDKALRHYHEALYDENDKLTRICKKCGRDMTHPHHYRVGENP